MDFELAAQSVRGSKDGEWERFGDGGIDEGGGPEGSQEKANTGVN